MVYPELTPKVFRPNFVDRAARFAEVVPNRSDGGIDK